MNTAQRFALLLPVFIVLAGCGGDMPTSQPKGMSDASPPERGPNNGRLLADGDFVLELAIYEMNVPPEFRAWATLDGRPLRPDDVDLHVTLTRFGNEIDEIEFKPQADFLRSTSTVHEPHSFVVAIDASYQGRSHHWQYESFEGRTRIDSAMAEAFALETAVAGPAVLKEAITLYGQIGPQASRVREVTARFDGTIRSVGAALGDTVRAGQALATVESNESLRPYTIEAPIAGIITERNANPGEQTAGRRLFIIVDTSSVWANLSVFLGDRTRVRVGAPVTVTATLSGSTQDATVSHINAIADANQSVTARVVLDNGDGAWALGTFVTAQARVAETNVPLAVKRSGLQSFRDFTVVYAQVGEEYEVRMLELGRQDGEWVEVLGGLKPGTRYVTRNSYVLKADIEKSGASHDH